MNVCVCDYIKFFFIFVNAVATVCIFTLLSFSLYKRGGKGMFCTVVVGTIQLGGSGVTWLLIYRKVFCSFSICNRNYMFMG